MIANRGPILVVDDDKSILGLMQMVLEDEGYEVIIAQDGITALEAIEKRPPRLILLDICMPNMDGPEFVKAYRNLQVPPAPIISVTAGCDAAKEAERMGINGYLRKPFNLTELFDTVAKHITDDTA